VFSPSPKQTIPRTNALWRQPRAGSGKIGWIVLFEQAREEAFTCQSNDRRSAAWSRAQRGPRQQQRPSWAAVDPPPPRSSTARPHLLAGPRQTPAFASTADPHLLSTPPPAPLRRNDFLPQHRPSRLTRSRTRPSQAPRQAPPPPPMLARDHLHTTATASSSQSARLQPAPSPPSHYLFARDPRLAITSSVRDTARGGTTLLARPAITSAAAVPSSSPRRPQHHFHPSRESPRRSARRLDPSSRHHPLARHHPRSPGVFAPQDPTSPQRQDRCGHFASAPPPPPAITFTPSRRPVHALSLRRPHLVATRRPPPARAPEAHQPDHPRS
jgi:hypothetical protein